MSSSAATEPAHGGSDLDAAVAVAVAEGLRAADRLAAKITGALEQVQRVADAAAAGHGDRPGSDAIASFTQLVTEALAEAEDRFARQRSRLETFNLVLFGRTGTGKSSLIEALSSGDGEPISEGESDWTTDVRDVRWRATRLFDTPGIGGWGRTVSRNELESRAEAAVAEADVVLLCFDSQSQQAGEFSKIAEWVSRYGKPVVAVLNSRNPRWRAPTKVGRQSARRDLSRTVHEHVGNIRDELAKIGLSTVPVVAIHTKRASFARTTDPYTGPDAEGRQRQRELHGPDRLLAWSNLPALEMLLSEALAQHATPLRLGMLHEHARGLLTAALSAVRTEGEQAVQLAEHLERGITDVLGLVGRPRDKRLAKEVGRLEKLRGGGFGAGGPSELLRHSRHRLAAGLRGSRIAALRRADHLIEEAFADGKDLDRDTFDREVLAPARMEAEAVARSVGAELQDYLLQRLELVADDLRADLDAAVDDFEGTDTAAGRIARAVGLSMEVASGLLAVGSGAMAAAAVMNIWNPAGWVLGAVTVSGAVVGFIGGRVRQRAASARLSALSAARSASRRSVTDTFDLLERLISEDLHRILATAAHERLATHVAQASALRRIAASAARAERMLQTAVEDVPEVVGADQLLLDVARDLQRRLHPGEPNAERLLWLGESWCTDPEGNTDSDAPEAAVADEPHPDLSERSLAQIGSIIAMAAGAPAPGSGAEWLRTTLDVLGGDTVAVAELAPVVVQGTTQPPRVVVAGDYSTGKSSFIKRLLVDAGQGVPEQLGVAAQPKTTRPTAFPWCGWELIDTPGFQSASTGHADAAHEAIAGASVLVALFNPNLVVGETGDLATVLFGDQSAGRTGKFQRTLFVINRSDELGVDPREDPVGYQNLCRRKELELAQALGMLSERAAQPVRGGVRPGQFLCVASDPYGSVGDRTDVTRADYEQHRDWDGMDSLRRGLTEAVADFGRNGADIQILEVGAISLGSLVARRRQDLRALEASTEQRRRLLLDLDACLHAGSAIRDAGRDRLATSFVTFVGGLFDDVGAAVDKSSRAAHADRLEGWASDQELQQHYREWATRFTRDLEEWQEATTARVEARLASAAFLSAFPGDGTDVEVDHLRPEGPDLLDAAGPGARQLAEAAASAQRETVTKVAHALGHKFRPWGATKLTSKVNLAGGALGVVFGGMELYSTWRSIQRESASERSAADARSAALRRVREAAEAFFDSPDPDAPGGAMSESLAHVQHARDEEARRLADEAAELDALTLAIDVCESQMRDALERLEPIGS